MTAHTSGPMAPLFVPLPPGEEARTRCKDAQKRLAPFFKAGVLASVDLHVVARLGMLTDELNPDLLLALALAVRAPRHGHVGANLSTLDDSLLPLGGEDLDQEDRQPSNLQWPQDKAALIGALAGCTALVRSRDERDRPTPFVLDGDLLYLDRYWRYQGRLAELLNERAAAPLLPPADPELLGQGIRLMLKPHQEKGGASPPGLDRQQLAAAVAALRRLTVLSGGPGMGKTYTIRVVLVLLHVQWRAARLADPSIPPLDVALAAPTGKAANRMKESLGEGLDQFLWGIAPALGEVTTPEEVRRFLTGLSTFTLHRLLGWKSRTPTRFRHNADHPLPQQVVVVDEASMVDLALMTKLVDAVSPGARLLLIGDRHQLASVEAGTVLADICGATGPDKVTLSRPFALELRKHCGLELSGDDIELTREDRTRDCIVQLNRYHRFRTESGIGAFARACLQGKPVEAAAVLTDQDNYQDAALLPHGEGGQLGPSPCRAIVSEYRTYLEMLAGGPDGGEPEQAFHLRLLRALDRFRVLCVHRKGRLGVTGLNMAVEELLRKARIKGFAPGSGNYRGQPIIVHQNDYTVGRFNGDVGVVVNRLEGATDERHRRRLWVAFPGAGDTVEYLAPSRLPEHQTVFAMTIHKSQGSQFQHAMVVLPTRSTPILTRELIYTGVTRAARRMTMIGGPELLVKALAEQVTRASGLEKELWGSRD